MKLALQVVMQYSKFGNITGNIQNKLEGTKFET